MARPKTRQDDFTLQFSWTMSSGLDQIDADPDNPLARALDRLLSTGQPLQKLALCFISLPESKDDTSAVRWLGAFVYSAGDRLIFFPGYAQAPEKLIGFRGTSLVWNESAITDHVSLEKNRNRWHATTPESKQHFGGPQPLAIGNDCVLWFGMSFPDSGVLREASKMTLVSRSVPTSDAERRNHVFQQAREAVSVPVVGLNTETRYEPNPGFYHLSVIVGPVGFPIYKGAEHGFPRGSPFLETPLPDVFSVPIATYLCSLSPFCDVQITLMKLPGRLNTPISLTSPGNTQTQAHQGDLSDDDTAQAHT